LEISPAVLLKPTPVVLSVEPAFEVIAIIVFSKLTERP
jgi:hypothetical protein